MPRTTAIALLYLIAAWTIIFGITQIIAAVRLRRVITGEWLLMLAGIISVLFGILLFIFPIPGALAVVIWIGVYAIVLGIVLALSNGCGHGLAGEAGPAVYPSAISPG